MTMAAPITERCVFEFGGYRLSIRPGTSRRLVLSLAGLDGTASHTTAAPTAIRRAFQGTFSRLRCCDHIAFIQDAKHSWFDATEGFADLVKFIRDYAENSQIEERVAIGFSMGATGAIVLDAALGLDRVICLVPQGLIGSALCPWDERYIAAWDNILTIRHPSVALMMRRDGRYFVLVPLDIMEDVRHAAVLSRGAGSLQVFVTRCGEHNILEELRRSRLQDDLVRELIAGSTDLERFGYRHMPIDKLVRLDAILGSADDTSSLDDVYAFAQSNPQFVPTCLYRVLRDAEVARSVTRRTCSEAFPTHCRHICRPEELRYYACEGWYAFDQGFTWSEGVHHAIRFRIIDFDDHAEVRVRLFFLPFVTDAHRHQRVAFYVNGRLCEEVTARAGTPSATRLEVELALEQADVAIWIVTPDCTSPARLGVGADPRCIALSFNHMLLRARGARPPRVAGVIGEG